MLNLLVAFSTCSSQWTLHQTQYPPSQSKFHYGKSAAYAIDTNRVVISDESAPVNGVNNVGCLYVYDYSYKNREWKLISKIEPENTREAHIYGLGCSLAVTSNGKRIVAGAPSSIVKGEKNNGAVVVFDEINGAWIQTSVLIPEFPIDFLGFGRSLSLLSTGREVIIGATNDIQETASLMPGCAFVFTEEDGIWLQMAKIDPPSSGYGSAARFATKIQVQGFNDMMITSTSKDGENKYPAFYWRNAQGDWILDSTAPEIEGVEVESISGGSSTPPRSSKLLSLIATDTSTHTASAYILEKVAGVWSGTPDSVLSPPTNSSSITGAYMCSERLVVLTDPLNSQKAQKGGAIHIYQDSGKGFKLIETIYPPEAEENLRFGSSLETSENCDTIIVGAYASDVTAIPNEVMPRSYIYVRADPPSKLIYLFYIFCVVLSASVLFYVVYFFYNKFNTRGFDELSP